MPIALSRLAATTGNQAALEGIGIAGWRWRWWWWHASLAFIDSAGAGGPCTHIDTGALKFNGIAGADPFPASSEPPSLQSAPAALKRTQTEHVRTCAYSKQRNKNFVAAHMRPPQQRWGHCSGKLFICQSSRRRTLVRFWLLFQVHSDLARP